MFHPALQLLWASARLANELADYHPTDRTEPDSYNELQNKNLWLGRLVLYLLVNISSQGVVIAWNNAKFLQELNQIIPFLSVRPSLSIEEEGLKQAKISVENLLAEACEVFSEEERLLIIEGLFLAELHLISPQYKLPYDLFMRRTANALKCRKRDFERFLTKYRGR